MDQIQDFFFGNTVTHYIEVGFTDRQAQAMSWIAEQKSKGKFFGLLGGSFLAFGWSHWSPRIMAHIGIKCSKIYFQLALIGLGITAGDYLLCQRRYGANEYIANNLYLNNNLFMGNLASLTHNFEVLNRKFTAEQVKAFNQRARALTSSIPIKNRKWIFNPMIQTEEQFNRRKLLNLNAPWEDPIIRAQIKQENKDKSYIVYGPKQLGKLIDETGNKLGVVNKFAFGWRPLQV